MSNAAELAGLPLGLFEQAVAGLLKHLSPADLQWLAERIAAHPENWVVQNRWHFQGGMSVRNLLRSDVGIADKLLPHQNWDHYYVAVVEEAVRRFQAGLA